MMMLGAKILLFLPTAVALQPCCGGKARVHSGDGIADDSGKYDKLDSDETPKTFGSCICHALGAPFRGIRRGFNVIFKGCLSRCNRNPKGYQRQTNDDDTASEAHSAPDVKLDVNLNDSAASHDLTTVRGDPFAREINSVKPKTEAEVAAGMPDSCDSSCDNFLDPADLVQWGDEERETPGLKQGAANFGTTGQFTAGDSWTLGFDTVGTITNCQDAEGKVQKDHQGRSLVGCVVTGGRFADETAIKQDDIAMLNPYCTHNEKKCSGVTFTYSRPFGAAFDDN